MLGSQVLRQPQILKRLREQVSQLAARGTSRPKAVTGDMVRSQGRLRDPFARVCPCARGTLHSRNVLWSMPAIRSLLCCVYLLEVHAQPWYWLELGMWNLTFVKLLKLATHNPFGWSLCVWLSFSSAFFWVWLK